MSRSTARPHRLYEQVAAEIRRAIAEGEAKPGERLPPAKDLAAVLDVNTNTVLRALRLLRDEGLLEFRRGRGISVAGTPERGAVIQRAESSSPSPAGRATAWTSWSRSSKTSADEDIGAREVLFACGASKPQTTDPDWLLERRYARREDHHLSRLAGYHRASCRRTRVWSGNRYPHQAPGDHPGAVRHRAWPLNPTRTPPKGLIFHASGPIDGGWGIIDFWESRETRCLPGPDSGGNGSGGRHPAGPPDIEEFPVHGSVPA